MPSPASRDRLINGLLATAGVGLCLLQVNWLALLALVTVLLLHERISLAGEWRLLLQVSVLGWLHDAILLRSGVLTGVEMPALWQLCIWPLLGTLLCHALRFVHQRLWLALLLGAVAGPLLSQFLIHATRVDSDWQPLPLLLLMALVWSLLLPLLVFIARSRVTLPAGA